MNQRISELLQKSLNMTPEQLREAQERARVNSAKTAGGRNYPVPASSDFTRIKNLSSRSWNLFQSEEFVDAVTSALRTDDGTMRVRPIQACALIEMQRAVEIGARGAACLMGVGSGKALVSMLAGSVLDSQRTVLLVPPSLVEQTHRVYNQMRQHWQVMPAPNFHVVSYSTLSSPKQGDILERIKPDLIVADEASALKNRTATRTKRFMRHLRLFKPRVVVLSGTLTSRSLKDFQHLFEYIFGDLSPVPAHYPTLNEWCDALDANISDFKRRHPGKLLEFRTEETQVDEDKEVENKGRALTLHEQGRLAFRTRMISTLGVVSTAADRLGTSLVFNRRPLELSSTVKVAMDQLLETWERPDGEAFSDVLELAAVERELSCGFWYKWVWPTDKDGKPVVDEEWLEARKKWNRAVREKLQRAAPGIDSPLLVFNAALRAHEDLHPHPTRKNDPALPRFHHKDFEPWLKVKDRPVPPTVPVWVDDSFMVDDAVAWGNESPGIIWYSHAAVGEKIAERGGFPLYGPGKKASQEILDEKGNRTIVVSMNAHSEGKNLQHAFWRNLITTPTASGKIMEQVCGRTHREGQPNDEVTVDVYLHTHSFQRAWLSAMRDAEYMESLLGPQKLVYGTKTFDVLITEERKTPTNGPQEKEKI